MNNPIPHGLVWPVTLAFVAGAVVGISLVVGDLIMGKLVLWLIN